MKQIEIRIGADGKIDAETKGIKGKNCLQYLERIEKMANAVTQDSKFTDEYYEVEERIQHAIEKEEYTHEQ